MSRRIVLLAAWPLFAGLTVIMIGNGLQATLLGLRASIESFNTYSIGIIMSMYYVGFLAGSLIVPGWVRNVGHIRVFAALASLASTTILAHGIFMTPVIWTAARAITGFSFAGLYVVIESWINSLANRKTRGSILAIYNVIHYTALAAGQMCLYIAPPESINPFILTSVLVSLAAIPISLSRRSAPSHTESERLSLKELWAVSPLSFYATGMSGFCIGIFYTLAPVYGANIGMSTQAIANFMALFLMGGIFGQLPLGILSDKIGRRKTLIGVTTATSIAAMLCFIVSGSPLLLNAFFFLLGSTSLTIYALGSALAIDNLNPNQYIAGASSLLIANGAGAIVGPLIMSLIMDIHIQSFFPALAIGYFSITVFGLYRSTVTEALPTEDQESYYMSGAVATGVTSVTSQIAAQVAEQDSIDQLKKSGS